MNTNKIAGAVVGAAVVVAGVILFLQNFDAGKVACDAIDEARTEVQAMYEAGVSASVQVYAEEKAEIDERLSQCINAKPEDPCTDAQKARDDAVANFNGITSPADSASYAEFQTYFAKREEAYNTYKSAKAALDACRAENPPKDPVPYEESDTKACFDAYDASVAQTQATFTTNTQTLRVALNAALAALDAREKACNPPKGKEKFTDPIEMTDGSDGGSVPVNILNCRPVNADADAELIALRQRAAALPAEIESVEESIENIRKRMSPLQRDLSEVDTYIPPQAAQTQFEGALNALRAERKVSIESSLDFYKNLLSRRQAEKAALEKELSDIQAKIQARLAQIAKENEARQRNFPTSVHLAKPEAGGCEYFHCHGTLCGMPDPAGDGCGHGATTEGDVNCQEFMDAYFEAAGI